MHKRLLHKEDTEMEGQDIPEEWQFLLLLTKEELEDLLQSNIIVLINVMHASGLSV